ncbi:hypothetical protein DFQ28_004431 [Apophysomyces sp. BC1034]|nr:hypothetical protein DFQ30_001118 [Apophysomyces sp. BC1015]KAG0180731.1 hypothetical protein DFQ29_010236 [Apophysomyces sp. BC1021]KAG0188732.1 hypothetical protein DFQ28_004431 [Apophysomyces sp. BC1034]
MDTLLSQIYISYEVLDRLQTIYYERAQLEHEFGQKLMALSVPEEETEGVARAIDSVNLELKKAAQSHMDLAQRLNQQIAVHLNQWLVENRETLDTVREKYLMHHQSSTGPTPQLQALDSEYRSMLISVEATVEEWNLAWKDACDQLELMEIQRIDFLMNNVWDYANLASAQLLVQDEAQKQKQFMQYCEAIRSRLETIDVKTELARYIQYGTGSTMPTASDYILQTLQTDTVELPPMKVKQLPRRPPPSQIGTSGTAARVKRKPLPTLQEKKVAARGSLEELLNRLEVAGPQRNREPAPAPAPAPVLSSQRSTPINTRRDDNDLEHANHFSTRPVGPDGTRTLPRAMSTVSNEPTQTCMQLLAHETGQMYAPTSPRPSAQRLKNEHEDRQGHALSSAYRVMMSSLPPSSSAAAAAVAYPRCPPSPSHHGGDAPPPTALSAPMYGPPTLPMASSSPAGLSPAPSPMMQAQGRHSHTPSSPMMVPSQGGPYHTPPSPMMMMMMMPGQAPAPPLSPMMPSPMLPPPSQGYPPSSSGCPSPMMPSSMLPPPSQGYPPSSSGCPSPMMTMHQYQHPPTGLPIQLPDGRPIMQWARAKFDYFAQDETEITFKRGTLLAIFDWSQFDKWLQAEVWDELHQRWCGSGCVPENYIRII